MKLAFMFRIKSVAWPLQFAFALLLDWSKFWLTRKHVPYACHSTSVKPSLWFQQHLRETMGMYVDLHALHTQYRRRLLAKSQRECLTPSSRTSHANAIRELSRWIPGRSSLLKGIKWRMRRQEQYSWVYACTMYVWYHVCDSLVFVVLLSAFSTIWAI